MHVVVVAFVTKPEKTGSFRQRVLQQAEDSLRLEDRCRVFDVCVDRREDNRFLLYEVYDTPEAFEYHLDSAHFKAFDAETADWVVSKDVTICERLSEARL